MERIKRLVKQCWFPFYLTTQLTNPLVMISKHSHPCNWGWKSLHSAIGLKQLCTLSLGISHPQTLGSRVFYNLYFAIGSLLCNKPNVKNLKAEQNFPNIDFSWKQSGLAVDQTQISCLTTRVIKSVTLLAEDTVRMKCQNKQTKLLANVALSPVWMLLSLYTLWSSLFILCLYSI